jgi:hypothetical protein|tara:strand:- start:497 stop:640 length:144 start_codon:yes stop_codon:yes gene_type:complete
MGVGDQVARLGFTLGDWGFAALGMIATVALFKPVFNQMENLVAGLRA